MISANAFASEENSSHGIMRDDFIDHYFKTTEYHRRGDPSSAEDEYLKARELEPENPSILNLLGHLYRQRGDIDKAIMMFKQVLKLQKTVKSVIMARNSLAEIYIKQERYEEAISEFKECQRIDPDSNNKRRYRDKIYKYESKLSQNLDP